jgi:hypothetical protein
MVSGAGAVRIESSLPRDDQKDSDIVEKLA